MLEEHQLTSPELTGDWEKQLTDIEHGNGDKDKFIKGIADFTESTVRAIEALDKEKLRPERVELAPARAAAPRRARSSARTPRPTAARAGSRARRPGAVSSSGSASRGAR